jgi:hypothetical protein
MHCRRLGCSRCRRWSPRKCCFCAYGASTSRPTAYANVHRLRSPDCEKAVCCVCTVDLPMKWMYWTDLFTEAGETPIYSYTATAHEGAERATTDQITRFRDTARASAYILVAGLKSICQSMDLVECHMFEGLERATRYQRRGCAVRLPRVPDRTTKPCSVLELVVPCRIYPWSRCQSRQDMRSADASCCPRLAPLGCSWLVDLDITTPLLGLSSPVYSCCTIRGLAGQTNRHPPRPAPNKFRRRLAPSTARHTRRPGPALRV